MHNPVITKLPRTRLQSRVRKFWFNNVPGTLSVDGYPVSRRDIDTYGGPNPWLTDPISQEMEWLSRVRQTNLFEPHNSHQAEQCRILCERQGSELWTHYHQNFDFTLGCDSEIRAPKCLCIMPLYALKRIVPNNPFLAFQNPHCHHLNLVLRRRLARSCQIELSPSYLGQDLSKYDFIFTINTGENLPFKKTKTPVILYCHDMWPDDPGFQQVLDEYQPNILLTPYPSPWRKSFTITPRTQLIFAPFAPSMFFTRPNLDPSEKPIDLLVIGAVSGPIYVPRISLTAQISALNKSYQIEYSHLRGGSGVCWDGQTLCQRPKGPIRYLNQWSKYLGSAKYVIFGRLKSKKWVSSLLNHLLYDVFCHIQSFCVARECNLWPAPSDGRRVDRGLWMYAC